MKHRFLMLVVLFVLIDARSRPAQAQVPGLLSFQGRVLSNGMPFDGTGQFKFALVDGAGSVTYWSQDGTGSSGNQPTGSIGLPVSRGLYSVLLGDTSVPGMTAVPAGVFSNTDVRLRVWFNDGTNGFQHLVPDQRVAAVGYALAAASVAQGAIRAEQLDTTFAATLARLTGDSIFKGTVQADLFLGDGSGITSVDAVTLGGVAPAGFWKTTGNAGTTSVRPQFIGTTDNAALVLRAANQTVMRLEGTNTGGIRIIAGVNAEVSTESTNSAVLGGRDNVISRLAHESVIGGGLGNEIGRDQRSSVIGGGARNEILQDNQHAFIGGGRDNRIGTNSVISLVVGGGENRIANNVDGALMVGGFRNDVLGSTNPNRRQIAPVLLGGSDNEIGYESSWAVILGGDNNRIGTNCASAFIAGGTNNLVANDCGFSFAAGRRSRVNHPGAFVWSDSQNASFASRDTDTFNVRAAGGLHLNTDTSIFFGSSTRQMLNLYGDDYAIGIQASTHYSRTASGGSFSWFQGGVHSSSANTPGTGGTELMRLTSGGLRVNGTFVSASDRNLKQDIRPVDPDAVLARVADLPIAEWSYQHDPGARHLGPMAQDFHAAFAVGEDDRHIAMVDADGVALAAIQGLNRKLEAEVQAKNQRIGQLEDRLAQLEQLVGSLARQRPAATP